MDCEEPEKMSKQDLNDSGCVQDVLADYKSQVNLLDLCDDVLLYILKQCSPQDLKALGHTCPRLGSLVCDHTLWSSVDCRSVSVGERRLRWLLTHCLTDATNELKIKGYVSKTGPKCMGLNQEGPGSQCRIYDDPGVCTRCPFWPENIEEMKSNANNSSLLNLSSKPDTSQNSMNFEDFNQDPDESQSSGTLGLHPRVTANVSSLINRTLGITGRTSGITGRTSGITGRTSGITGCTAGITDRTGSSEASENKNNCPGPCFTLNSKLLLELSARCCNLRTLALEYCNIDYLKTKIRQFPPKLKKLSLKGSRIFNLPYRTSFLCKMNGRLPDLEYLDVSECEWFEPSSLMPLSKLSCLSHLYMRACVRLTECVAYASLAARYGFKELKVMDVRDTLLADSEISALGWLPKLEELYACPPRVRPTTDVHTHALTDDVHWHELEDWETAEPDYYKNKIPEPISMEEDEKIEDIMPPPTDPFQSERIIVIPGLTQVVHQWRPPIDDNRGPINLSPNRPQATRRPNEPGPSRDTKKNGEATSDDDEPKAKKAKICEKSVKNGESSQGTSSNGVKPVQIEESPSKSEESRRQSASSSQSGEGPSKSGEGPSKSGESSSQSGEGSSQSGKQKRPRAPEDEQPRFIRFRRRASMEELMANGHVTHTITVQDIITQMQEEGPDYGESFSLRSQDQFTLGPNLVTDLAIMRFGRADNDNINYVQIGRNEVPAMPNEIRPERSSLRILSMTGYRHISDRSLVHLATAAPNLMNVDFSRTNVSERGVDTFKAIRSDCEVVFSKYQDS